MYFVNITYIAEEDILSVIKYIANVLNAPTAANNLLNEIERQENTLKNTPNIYQTVSDEYLAKKGLKYTSIKNHILFYTVNEEEKTVNVIRFLYGRRNWKKTLKSNTF